MTSFSLVGHDYKQLTLWLEPVGKWKSQLMNIRIYHECEGGIEKSVPSGEWWQIGDCKGEIFLS